jgi:hypothetical protein
MLLLGQSRSSDWQDEKAAGKNRCFLGNHAVVLDTAIVRFFKAEDLTRWKRRYG